VHIVFCNPDTAAFAFVRRSSRGFVSSFYCSSFHAFTPCTCKIKRIIIRTSSICFTRLTICNVRNPKNEKIKEEKDSLPTRCSTVASELWLVRNMDPHPRRLVPPSGHHFFLCVPEAADAEVEVELYDA
jgi:hypothetical protein